MRPGRSAARAVQALTAHQEGAPFTGGCADLNPDRPGDRARIQALALPPVEGIGPGLIDRLVKAIEGGVGQTGEFHQSVQPRHGSG